jgi:transposase
MPVRTYQYGSPSKMIATGEAENQVRLQISFWNELVRLDRDFTQRFREMANSGNEKISSLNEKLEIKKQEIDSIRNAVKNGAKGGQSSEKLEAKQKIATLLGECKSLIAELKTSKSEARIMIKPRLHDIEIERRDSVKKLRQKYAAERLYWGNYNAVLRSYQTARSRAAQTGGEVQFHRYDGTGRWTCQIQGGMTVDEAFYGVNNLFQLTAVQQNAWSHPSKGERKRLCRSSAKMRIASDAESNPIWLEIPFTMHRPIPSDGKIQFVSINTRKVGDRIRWFLNITVVEKEPEKEGSPSGLVLAVNIGCREEQDGALRVAYWAANNGGAGEVKLDESFVKTHKRISSLQKTRDDNFDSARIRLAQWLPKQAKKGALPDWLSQWTGELTRPKAQGKLTALIQHWRINRLEGDGEIFEFLESWRQQDKHLWSWQSNLRNKMTGRRLEQYRVFAAKAARQYDSAIFEELSLQRLKGEKRWPRGGDGGSESWNLMNIVSASILRREIKRALDSAGKPFIKVHLPGSKVECPFCGKNTQSDERPGVLLSCEDCGKVYDLDWAKAKSLLSIGLLSAGDQ